MKNTDILSVVFIMSAACGVVASYDAFSQEVAEHQQRVQKTLQEEIDKSVEEIIARLSL